MLVKRKRMTPEVVIKNIRRKNTVLNTTVHPQSIIALQRNTRNITTARPKRGSIPVEIEIVIHHPRKNTSHPGIRKSTKIQEYEFRNLFYTKERICLDILLSLWVGDPEADLMLSCCIDNV